MRVDWAQCRIAARISAEHSGCEAGHDLFGWYPVRLDDGHAVRASGPSGLRSLIGVALPFTTWHAIAELRRAFPAWHIWRDGTSWHARRRGNFRQEYRPGPPLYAVHGADAVELRGLLDEQTAGQRGPQKPQHPGCPYRASSAPERHCCLSATGPLPGWVAGDLAASAQGLQVGVGAAVLA
jgi:hypothetical protein